MPHGGRRPHTFHKEVDPAWPTKPEWADRFFDTFELSANWSASCRRAGIDRHTAYDRMESDPNFRRTVDEAKKAIVERLETHGIERAQRGSDRLLIWFLKTWDPARYNLPANVQLTGTDGGPIQIDAAGELNDRIDRLLGRLESDAEADSDATESDETEDDS